MYPSPKIRAIKFQNSYVCRIRSYDEFPPGNYGPQSPVLQLISSLKGTTVQVLFGQWIFREM